MIIIFIAILEIFMLTIGILILSIGAFALLKVIIKLMSGN